MDVERLLGSSLRVRDSRDGRPRVAAHTVPRGFSRRVLLRSGEPGRQRTSAAWNDQEQPPQWRNAVRSLTPRIQAHPSVPGSCAMSPVRHPQTWRAFHRSAPRVNVLAVRAYRERRPRRGPDGGDGRRVRLGVDADTGCRRLSEEAGSPVTSEGGDAAGVAAISLPAVRRYGKSCVAVDDAGSRALRELRHLGVHADAAAWSGVRTWPAGAGESAQPKQQARATAVRAPDGPGVSTRSARLRPRQRFELPGAGLFRASRSERAGGVTADAGTSGDEALRALHLSRLLGFLDVLSEDDETVEDVHAQAETAEAPPRVIAAD